MIRSLPCITCAFFIALNCSNKKPLIQKSNVLAVVGDKIITVQDFIRRAEYSIRPDYCKQSNYIHKKIVLNSLIAEKLTALEMERSEDKLLKSKNFQNFLTGRKEQAMRQLYYNDNFFANTVVPDSTMKKFLPLSGRTVEVNYINLPDVKTTIDVQKMLNKNVSISSIYNSLWTGEVPSRKINFFDKEGNFHIRPFIYRQVAARDPKTLRFVYEDDLKQKDFIYFFVRGEPYTMLGFINSDIHFFGVKEGSLFLLGTDIIGRDLLSRIIFGGRVSLSIGLIGVIILLIIGTIIGTISGYYGGWIDNFIQRIIEIIRTIPQVALWMALASIIPKEWPSIYVYLGIVIIFGLIGWAGLAREVRGKVLAIRRSDFIYAAEVSGASASRIIAKHIIPNVLSHIIVIATLSIPIMIIGEAALSFLGLGIKPPMTSWGLLLNQLREVQTLKHFPWLISPALFLVVSVLCYNFIGDALRDVNDPHSR